MHLPFPLRVSAALGAVVLTACPTAAQPATRPSRQVALEKKLGDGRRLLVTRVITVVNEEPKVPIDISTTRELKPSRVERFTFHLKDDAASEQIWAFDWGYINIIPGSLEPARVLDADIEGDKAFVVFEQTGTTGLWIAEMTKPPQLLWKVGHFCELARSLEVDVATVHSCAIHGSAKDGTMTVSIDKETQSKGRQFLSYSLEWRDDKPQLVPLPTTQPATSRKADGRK